MRVVGCKLLVHPTQVENAVDLSNQMIWRHHLVQIKRIKELTLSAFPPTHHEPLPQESLQATESWLSDRLNESFATHSGVKRTLFGGASMSAFDPRRTFSELLNSPCAAPARSRMPLFGLAAAKTYFVAVCFRRLRQVIKPKPARPLASDSSVGGSGVGV